MNSVACFIVIRNKWLVVGIFMPKHNILNPWKKLLHPWMRFLFGNYSYSICLWRLKAGWLAGFMIFLCIVCTILFNVCFGKFVMTFIDIGEIGCTSIPKCKVLCILGQYRVFQPLAAIIAARRRVMFATRRCRHSTGIFAHSSGGLDSHKYTGVGYQYCWWHGPIHPKYVLWVCSLGILQAAPSWWRCPAEGDQVLPQHGDVWRYCLVSSNCPQNAARKMALRYFAKCPCSAHWWGIYQWA